MLVKFSKSEYGKKSELGVAGYNHITFQKPANIGRMIFGSAEERDITVARPTYCTDTIQQTSFCNECSSAKGLVRDCKGRRKLFVSRGEYHIVKWSADYKYIKHQYIGAWTDRDTFEYLPYQRVGNKWLFEELLPVGTALTIGNDSAQMTYIVQAGDSSWNLTPSMASPRVPAEFHRIVNTEHLDPETWDKSMPEPREKKKSDLCACL
jgi:hypothetical protein